MSNLKPAASPLSPVKQPTRENLNKDSNIGQNLLPDGIEPICQSNGPSLLKAGVLPPPSSPQSPKNGAFKLSQENIAIRIIMQEIEDNPYLVIKKIGKSGIKNQEELAEIAMKCAERAPGAVAKNFKDFDIKKEALRLKVALKCAEENSTAVIIFIKEFQITVPAAQRKIAFKCAKKAPGAVAENFKEFAIVNAAIRIEIARECVKKAPGEVAQCIKNFDIKEEAVRIEIARECAKKAPGYLAENFNKFHIKNPAVRLEIARECAKINPWSVVKDIYEFDLFNTNLINEAIDLLNEAIEECLQENEFLCIQLSNHSHLSLLRQVLYHQGLVESEKLVDTERNNPLLDDVWRDLKFIHQHKFGGLPRAERSNLTAAVLQLHDPTMARAILYLIQQNSNNKTIASCYQEMAPLRLRQKFAWEVLLRWSLATLAAQGVSVEELITSLNTPPLFRQFRDKLKTRRLLDVLLKIGESTVLNKEDKQWVVKQLKGINDVHRIRMLLLLKAEKHLTKGDVSLKVRLDRAIHENIGEDIDVSNFSESIEGTFGKSRNPDAIWQFFVSMKQTGEPETMAAFRDYCSSVADGSFLQQRYDTKRSKHLEELVAIAPGSLAKWQEPVECAVNLSPATVDFAAKAWLKTKMVDDQHLGDFASIELIEFLGGSAASVPALAWQPEQAAAFTQTCRQLADVTQRQQHIDLLNALQQQLVDAHFTGEFLNDIQGQLQLLTQSSHQPKGELRGIDTDDPYHLLLCGTDVGGSCQRVDGNPHRNKGLLGYLLHGQTRLLAVVNAQERIVTRALLRWLIGKDDHGKPYPVLFLERTYGNLAYEPTLQALAQQKAAAMGLRVAHLGNFTKAYDNPLPELQSLGGPAPYEYCDASHHDVCENGAFTIEGAVWLEEA